MDELGRGRDLGMPGEAFLQPVLDRLDVVVGAGLDFLDAGRVGFGEGGRRLPQFAHRRRGKRPDLGQTGILRQRNQPFDLDPHAIADQRRLAAIGGERGELLMVAPVQGRER